MRKLNTSYACIARATKAQLALRSTRSGLAIPSPVWAAHSPCTDWLPIGDSSCPPRCFHAGELAAPLGYSVLLHFYPFGETRLPHCSACDFRRVLDPAAAMPISSARARVRVGCALGGRSRPHRKSAHGSATAGNWRHRPAWPTRLRGWSRPNRRASHRAASGPPGTPLHASR